jgi:methylmalonyl-CoA mutase C-terminal domain/subunit
VVYIGTHNTPDAAVQAAVQEDVDFIGLSFQGADHMPLLKAVVDKIDQAGLEDVFLVAGGNIPRQDIPQLKEMGVDQIFLPGTPLQDITDYFEQKGRKA